MNGIICSRANEVEGLQKKLELSVCSTIEMIWAVHRDLVLVGRNKKCLDQQMLCVYQYPMWDGSKFERQINLLHSLQHNSFWRLEGHHGLGILHSSYNPVNGVLIPCYLPTKPPCGMADVTGVVAQERAARAIQVRNQRH